jgi:hypothetical protein
MCKSCFPKTFCVRRGPGSPAVHRGRGRRRNERGTRPSPGASAHHRVIVFPSNDAAKSTRRTRPRATATAHSPRPRTLLFSATARQLATPRAPTSLGPSFYYIYILHRPPFVLLIFFTSNLTTRLNQKKLYKHSQI